jgi:hypothetical protein
MCIRNMLKGQGAPQDIAVAQHARGGMGRRKKKVQLKT